MFLQNSINSIIIQNEKNPTHFTFYRSLHNIKTFPHNLIYTIELQYQITIGVIDIFFVSLVFVKHRRLIIGTNLQFINRHLFKKFLYLLYNKGREAYIYNIIAFVFLKLFCVVFYLKFFKLKRHDVFLTTGPFLSALQIFHLLFDDEEKVDYEFIANLIFLWILFARTVLRLRFNNRRSFQYFILVVVVINAYTLYAGTLYTCRITALSHQKRSSSTALLASICFFLATLTIAARCYASKNATHSLAQFSSQPIFLSSIKDSKFQTYSSKIVLSRLFKSPKYKNTTSDISIIQKNSKYLLFTKNSKIQNSKSFAPHFRIRRELDTSALKSFNKNFLVNNQFIKHKADEHIRRKTFAEKTWSNKSIRGNVSATLDYKIRQSFKEINHKSRELQSQNLKSEIYLGKLFKTSRIDINNNFPLKSIKQSDNIVNVSANATGGIDTWRDFPRRNDQRLVQPLTEVEDKPTGGSGIDRSMPPAHDHSNNSHSNESTVLVLVVTAVILTVALGLVTCVLSHYRGGTAADPHDAGQTPSAAPMLSVVSAGATAGVGGMDRLRSHGAALELATTRDRQVRLHAVHTDIAINLPPNITLPDGEDHPFTNSRLHIRDPEQESEIYQKCIKPPPNRTVLESESPPPYRSSSAGLLGSIGSSSSGSSDWSGGGAPLMMRCHSMSSTSKRPEAGHSGQKTDFIQRTVKIFTGKKSQPPPAPTLPVVVVPMRLRQNSDLNQNSSGRHKPSV